MENDSIIIAHGSTSVGVETSGLLQSLYIYIAPVCVEGGLGNYRKSWRSLERRRREGGKFGATASSRQDDT